MIIPLQTASAFCAARKDGSSRRWAKSVFNFSSSVVQNLPILGIVCLFKEDDKNTLMRLQ